MKSKQILVAALIMSSGVSPVYSFSKSNHPYEEIADSVMRGAASVAVGILLGYSTVKVTECGFERIGALVGGIGGAVVDHFWLGGKNDEHQVARKLGNVVPLGIVIVGLK